MIGFKHNQLVIISKGDVFLFDLEKVKNLNELESVCYNYILTHPNEIKDMTIRDLSNSCHVSTSTILRALKKLGIPSYSELKYHLRDERNNLNDSYDKDDYLYSIHQADIFLKKINSKCYRLSLEPAIEMISKAANIFFFGIGTSGSLCLYADRYFSNLGISSFSIIDPFAPVPNKYSDDTLLITLSVSGETSEVIDKVIKFKQLGFSVLSITNNEKSTLAKLSDYNLAYHMPSYSSYIDPKLNLTSQVPVILLIEILANEVYNRTKQSRR